jgi:hypothetical protein
MNNTIPALSFRGFVQDLTGMELYFLSWMALTIAPVSIAIALIFLPPTFRIVAVLVLSLLTGLFLRWLARGVVEGRRTRLTLAVIITLAIGVGSLFSANDMLTRDDVPVALGAKELIQAAFFVATSLALMFVAVSPEKRGNDET